MWLALRLQEDPEWRPRGRGPNKAETFGFRPDGRDLEAVVHHGYAKEVSNVAGRERRARMMMRIGAWLSPLRTTLLWDLIASSHLTDFLQADGTHELTRCRHQGTAPLMLSLPYFAGRSAPPGT